MAFLEGYARALTAVGVALAARARLADRGDHVHAAGDPRSSRTPTGPGRFTVAFPMVRTERDVTRLANELFSLPGRIAAERKRSVVVALDEFQAIEAFNGGSVEHALRAAAQHQRTVGYVFAGSEPSLMEKMIGPRRPFYKAGPVMRLDRIAPDVFAAFIDERFASSGIRPEAGLGAAIVDLAGNLPYDVQRLAHETWDDVRAAGARRATLDDLHGTLGRLLCRAGHRCSKPSGSVSRSPSARSCARPCCRAAGSCCPPRRGPRFRLGGASSIQASLAALIKQDLLLGKAAAISWWIRCCANGWRARRSDGHAAAARTSRAESPELRAWAMYDWANSAFQSTVITAVFPRVLRQLRGRRPAAGGRDGARFAWATTIAVTIIALHGAGARRDGRLPGA